MERVAVAGDLITVIAVGRRRCGPCRTRGTAATRVYSRYRRMLAYAPGRTSAPSVPARTVWRTARGARMVSTTPATARGFFASPTVPHAHER